MWEGKKIKIKTMKKNQQHKKQAFVRERTAATDAAYAYRRTNGMREIKMASSDVSAHDDTVRGHDKKGKAVGGHGEAGERRGKCVAVGLIKKI